MTYDIVIRNGTVVDGTGVRARRADVGVVGGRIAEVGTIEDDAAHVIDATDLVVAPGFIDPHTHYDAQIWWDPKVTPSSWHGVTTVVIGNCGVGIAPCRARDREKVIADMASVEGIPYDVLATGIPWDWETFPEFMGAARARRFGVNVGFLCPLTPFRHFVLGDESTERAATADETAQVKSLLEGAIVDGALGWSTSMGNHIGFGARPVACRQASRPELRSYAAALRALGTGVIELLAGKAASIFTDDEFDLIDLLAAESGRPVTWTALVDRDDQPDACRIALAKAAPLFGRGALPQILAVPMFKDFTLASPSVFKGFSSWTPALEVSVADAAPLYASGEFRRAFREELSRPGRTFTGDWAAVTVRDVHAPALARLVGRTISEIAAEQRTDPLDTFFDIALADGLATSFVIALFNSDAGRVGELIADPRLLIGLGDAGAHVDVQDNSGYPTYVLGTWARERGVLSLEHAVHRLTGQPAHFFGLADRGEVRVGMAADLCVFDFDTVGAQADPPIKVAEWRRDLPGGARRLTWPKDPGIVHTIVNGVIAFADGTPNDALPGQVLSGVGAVGQRTC